MAFALAEGFMFSRKQARQESNLQPPVLEPTPSNAGVATFVDFQRLSFWLATPALALILPLFAQPANRGDRRPGEGLDDNVRDALPLLARLHLIPGCANERRCLSRRHAARLR
jgi:hypothetical protein